MRGKLLQGLKSYIVLFLLLTLIVHFSQWIDNPLEHLKSLPSSSLGVWHPLIITLGIYFILLLLKVIVRFIKNLITKKGKQS